MQRPDKRERLVPVTMIHLRVQALEFRAAGKTGFTGGGFEMRLPRSSNRKERTVFGVAAPANFGNTQSVSFGPDP